MLLPLLITFKIPFSFDTVPVIFISPALFVNRVVSVLVTAPPIFIPPCPAFTIVSSESLLTVASLLILRALPLLASDNLPFVFSTEPLTFRSPALFVIIV